MTAIYQNVTQKNHNRYRPKPLRRLDKVVIILLALCQILQHYKGLFQNASITILLCLFPYAVNKLINMRRIKLNQLAAVLPLIMFLVYQVIDHGTSVLELGQGVVLITFIIAIASGCFDTSYFVKVVTNISIAASICIIIQYICYYLLGFHLQLAPTQLLLESSEQWLKLAQTGRYSIRGNLMRFYRPSAFFLEPSHMFIYMFSPLTIALFTATSKKQVRLAALMGVGMVLSTSGMGILTVLLLFGLYMGKKGGMDKRFLIKRLFRPGTILTLLSFAGLCAILYFNVPFVRNSVERIFSSGEDYSNAFSGRTDSGMRLIQGMKKQQYIVGAQGNLKGINAALTGFTDTMFRFGIIGLVLSYAFYIRGLLTLKNEFFWIAALILVLSFFSQHTHMRFFLLYATFMYFEGYRKYGTKPNKWRKKQAFRPILTVVEE